MKIVGLRVEKYIGEEVSGHNCNFEYNDVELERHIILGLLEGNKKVEIELTTKEGECYSGWSTASWGNFEIRYVDKFNGYTHRPIKNIVVDDIDEDQESIYNDAFYVDCEGGDEYYPSGGYSVKMDLFKANGREKEFRPTYVFAGESGIGKSALALRLNDNTIVFETDAYDTLPEKILADVIVLGNKHGYTIEDLEATVIDTELVLCSFNNISK